MEKQSKHPSKEAGKSIPRTNRNVQEHDELLARQAKQEKKSLVNFDREAKRYKEKLKRPNK